jgi:hypothetical protein
MSYLHSEFQLGPDELVEVKLDKQANVRFLDSHNYQKYREGKSYTFFGGLAKKSPLRLAPPFSGYWHFVIDLDGYIGSVSASVKVITG